MTKIEPESGDFFAELVLGGSVPDGFDPGAYLAPTLFTGMHNDMQTAREEIFGPVGAVLSFPSIDEAVKIANDSIFGLAAGIWTSDVTIAHKMPCDIDAGVIWVNCFDHANSSTKSRRRSGNYDMLRKKILQLLIGDFTTAFAALAPRAAILSISRHWATKSHTNGVSLLGRSNPNTRVTSRKVGTVSFVSIAR